MLFLNTIHKLVLLLLFMTSTLFSQNMKELLNQGANAMMQKDYSSASQYYRQILLVDSANINHQFFYAEASRLNFDFTPALYWYKKVLDTDKGKTYPEVPFCIASLLKNTGKYKDAKVLFESYYKKQRTVKNQNTQHLVLKAKQEMEACVLAEELVSHPLGINILHLDSAINTTSSEYAPFELDSNLYFSSLIDLSSKDEINEQFNKLYLAKKSVHKENEFLKAQELDSLFNEKGIHNANTSFNANFTKVFVSRCSSLNSSQYRCDIYTSDFKNGHWTPFQKLPSPVNMTGYNTTQPCLSKINNKEILFFSSNRPNGEGGMDIWYVTTKQDGTFEKPINAGKNINTSEDEITPWFSKDDQTLYFSSTWHKGLGNFDIFFSKYENDAFNDAANMGYPINSSYNDIYYSINSKQDRAYLSSNRIGSFFEEKPNCCNDIYSFPISAKKTSTNIDTAISSIPLIERMKELTPLTLYFHNDEPEPRTKQIITNKNYKKTYEAYSLLIVNYLQEYSKGLKGIRKDSAINAIDHFFEDSLDAGMKKLNQFSSLLEEALSQGKKVNITLKGYCSPLASNDYNINLAKRRISSLINYFKEYKNGKFIRYINNANSNEGSIHFIYVEIGELKTTKTSDDFKDTKNSIYSPFAARERKIQIMLVDFAN